MSHNINTENQTVESCLKNRTYRIDFYQREYVWKKETVEVLLDDIFYQFELSYENFKDQDIKPETIQKYSWYYLNTYITNDVGGNEYIVDGQQRLTTLSLIAVKLSKLTENKNLKNSLENCIKGNDKYKGNIFRIDHEKRKNVMDYIMSGSEEGQEFENTTEKNIKARYKDISNYFDSKKITGKKLESFIYYFLDRLILVELKIDKEDTPMIFEVINDRGLELKPFEILKGKLLGSLDKDDIDGYNASWEDSTTKLKTINSESSRDEFFTDYLKGNFVYKRDSDLEKRLNNDYHRYIFEDNAIAKHLKFRRQDENYKQNIKNFIENDLTYFAALYAEICENEISYLEYNKDINGLSGQYQNILAACKVKDTKAVEEQKIETISKEIDRMYILLNLNGVYDSNNFQKISYALNKSLKDACVSEYRNIFNQQIRNRIKEKLERSDAASLLDYGRFKIRGYELNTRVLRYLLARIENYICERSGQEMQRDVSYLATKTGAKTGYHVEHILANNEENKKYFESEEEFWEQRNRLGGLSLLLGKNNISSSNEFYSEKRKTYSNGLMLCKTLTEECYKSNLDFTNWNDGLEHKFRYEIKFDKDALEHRSKVFYHLVKRIWEA